MSQTLIYKGWISVSPPRRGKDATVIISPGRFFYRPKNHIIAEKFSTDIDKYGSFVNVRFWASYKKIKQDDTFFQDSYMGEMNAEYNEVGNSLYYMYSNHLIDINYFDFLEYLIRYNHHYCIIEVTYSQNEFDMVSHEAELILLRD